MPLRFEELKSFVVSDHSDLSSEEFVLPFKEGFKDGDGFHLKYLIVHLCYSELFRHEAGRATCLPCCSLAVHHANARHGGVAYDPDWVVCLWIDWLKDQQSTGYHFYVAETCFM